jgi:hypothetical protein
VLADSVCRLEQELPDDAVVLDIGAWGRPFRRADLVMDQMPYETRGLYGFDGAEPERFDASRWLRRDICDKTPFPFEDNEIDFVICSHTLEDIRDPIWVCQEMVRIAKAGYVEVPSRLQEQSYGVNGPWVGWSHHRWLVDIDAEHRDAAHIDFVYKPHFVHGKPAAHFPAGFAAALSPQECVQWLWWTGRFTAAERVFTTPAEIDHYVESFVQDELARRPAAGAPVRRPRRFLSRSK